MSNFCKFDYFNGLSFNIVQILDRLSEQIFRIVCVYRSFVFRSFGFRSCNWFVHFVSQFN
jgi:hypothetical protein